MSRFHYKWMSACLLTVPAVSGSPVAGAEVTFQGAVAPILEKHCRDCHAQKDPKGPVRLDQLKEFQSSDRHLWTVVHEMIESGAMPPRSRPQLSDTEREQLLTWIKKEQRALGKASTRRLNRRELSAALQDLTGLAVDYADAMPGDGKVAGFDTGAEGLQDAAASVARLLEVTRRAVDAIRFREPAPKLVFRANLREAKDPRKAFDVWKEAGANVKVRGSARPGEGLLIEPKWVGERGGFDLYVPAPANNQGVLRLELIVSVMEKSFAGIPEPHLWVKVAGKTIDYREITSRVDKPARLFYEVQLDDLAIGTRGVHVELSNRVEIPYAVKGFENEDRTKSEDKIPGGSGLFRPLHDRKAAPEKRPVPFLVLQSIEITPCFVAAWPPANWQTGIDKINDDVASAARLLSPWMERAYRRPVRPDERDHFLAFYRKLRDQNMSFDDALRAAFQSVLMSAPFRYLASPADADKVIGQHALASRLSFMLIGAPPDGELRRRAAAGQLQEPKTLDAQVDRLLADPRSEAFVRPFVMQWLEMEQPITIAMSHIQKQDFRFGRFLKASMREETLSYVRQMLLDNRPARELIDSDWTMMNNSLARHYGYADINGAALRKVKLRPDGPRGGGILAHAGIQSMLCWMGENWVIYRGAWALRHILDDAPPPPPLEVPELSPSDGKNAGKSFRELLRQHQADSRCAVCHKDIDPLGFAFQNFDLSGRWREVEFERYVRNELDGKIEWRGAGKTRPVDAVGRLPRGEEFKSFAEFKRLAIKHYQADMVRGLLKNLLLYGTGRQPDVDDLAEIKVILNEQGERGYPLRDLIKAVVHSQAFLDQPSQRNPR